MRSTVFSQLYRSIQKNEAFESRIPPTETLAKLIQECVLKKFAHFSMDGEQKFICLFKDRWDVTSPTLGSYQRANITTTTSNILPTAVQGGRLNTAH